METIRFKDVLRGLLDDVYFEKNEGLLNVLQNLELLEIVSSLDDVTDIQSNKIYLVLSENGSEGNEYDLYIYVNGKWEKIDPATSDVIEQGSSNAISSGAVYNVVNNLNRLSNHLTSLYDNLVDFNEELIKFDDDNENLSEDLDLLKDNLSGFLNRITGLLSDVSDLQEANDNLSSANENLYANLEDLDSRLSDFSSDLNGFEEDLGEFNTRVTGLSDTLTTTNNNLSTLSDGLSEVEDRVGDLDEGLADLTDGLGELQTELNTTKTTLTTTRSSLSDLQTELDGTKTLLNTTRTELSDLTDDLDDTKSSLTETQNDLDETKDSLENTKNALITTQNDLNDLGEDLEDTKDALTETQNDLTSLTGELNTTKDALTTAQNGLNELNTELDTTNSSLDTLETGLNTVNTEITGLKTNDTNLQGGLNTLTGQLGTATTRIGDLESSTSSLRTDLTEAQGALDEFEESLDDFETRLTSASSDLFMLSSDLSTLQDNLTTTDGRLTTVEGDFTNLNSQFNSLNTTLTGLQSEFNELSPTFNEILDKLTDSAGNLIITNEDITALSDRLNSFYDELNILGTALSDFEGDFNDFTDELESEGVDVSEFNINDDVINLFLTINSVKGSVADLNNNIIPQVQSDISNVQTDIYGDPEDENDNGLIGLINGYCIVEDAPIFSQDSGNDTVEVNEDIGENYRLYLRKSSGASESSKSSAVIREENSRGILLSLENQEYSLLIKLDDDILVDTTINNDYIDVIDGKVKWDSTNEYDISDTPINYSTLKSIRKAFVEVYRLITDDGVITKVENAQSRIDDATDDISDVQTSLYGDNKNPNNPQEGSVVKNIEDAQSDISQVQTDISQVQTDIVDAQSDIADVLEDIGDENTADSIKGKIKIVNTNIGTTNTRIDSVQEDITDVQNIMLGDPSNDEDGGIVGTIMGNYKMDSTPIISRDYGTNVTTINEDIGENYRLYVNSLVSGTQAFAIIRSSEGSTANYIQLIQNTSQEYVLSIKVESNFVVNNVVINNGYIDVVNGKVRWDYVNEYDISNTRIVYNNLNQVRNAVVEVYPLISTNDGIYDLIDDVNTNIDNIDLSLNDPESGVLANITDVKSNVSTVKTTLYGDNQNPNNPQTGSVVKNISDANTQITNTNNRIDTTNTKIDNITNTEGTGVLDNALEQIDVVQNDIYGDPTDNEDGGLVGLLTGNYRVESTTVFSQNANTLTTVNKNIGENYRIKAYGATNAQALIRNTEGSTANYIRLTRNSNNELLLTIRKSSVTVMENIVVKNDYVDVVDGKVRWDYTNEYDISSSPIVYNNLHQILKTVEVYPITLLDDGVIKKIDEAETSITTTNSRIDTTNTKINTITNTNGTGVLDNAITSISNTNTRIDGVEDDIDDAITSIDNANTRIDGVEENIEDVQIVINGDPSDENDKGLIGVLNGKTTLNSSIFPEDRNYIFTGDVIIDFDVCVTAGQGAVLQLYDGVSTNKYFQKHLGSYGFGITSTWAHVTVTMIKGLVECYVNGVKKDSLTTQTNFTHAYRVGFRGQDNWEFRYKEFTINQLIFNDVATLSPSKEGDVQFYYTGCNGTEVDAFVPQTGANAVTIASDTNGTTFTATGSSTGYVWANKNGTSTDTSAADWTGNFSFEFDVVSTDSGVYWGVYEKYTGGGHQSTSDACQVGHNRIVRKDNTFSFYVNNVLKSTKTLTTEEALRIGFFMNSGKKIKIKNFSIYIPDDCLWNATYTTPTVKSEGTEVSVTGGDPRLYLANLRGTALGSDTNDFDGDAFIEFDIVSKNSNDVRFVIEAQGATDATMRYTSPALAVGHYSVRYVGGVVYFYKDYVQVGSTTSISTPAKYNIRFTVASGSVFVYKNFRIGKILFYNQGKTLHGNRDMFTAPYPYEEDKVSIFVENNATVVKASNTSEAYSYFAYVGYKTDTVLNKNFGNSYRIYLLGNGSLCYIRNSASSGSNNLIRLLRSGGQLLLSVKTNNEYVFVDTPVRNDYVDIIGESVYYDNRRAVATGTTTSNFHQLRGTAVAFKLITEDMGVLDQIDVVQENISDTQEEVEGVQIVINGDPSNDEDGGLIGDIEGLNVDIHGDPNNNNDNGLEGRIHDTEKAIEEDQEAIETSNKAITVVKNDVYGDPDNDDDGGIIGSIVGNYKVGSLIYNRSVTASTSINKNIGNSYRLYLEGTVNGYCFVRGSADAKNLIRLQCIVQTVNGVVKNTIKLSIMINNVMVMENVPLKYNYIDVIDNKIRWDYVNEYSFEGTSLNVTNLYNMSGSTTVNIYNLVKTDGGLNDVIDVVQDDIGVVQDDIVDLHIDIHGDPADNTDKGLVGDIKSVQDDIGDINQFTGTDISSALKSAQAIIGNVSLGSSNTITSSIKSLQTVVGNVSLGSNNTITSVVKSMQSKIGSVDIGTNNTITGTINSLQSQIGTVNIGSNATITGTINSLQSQIGTASIGNNASISAAINSLQSKIGTVNIGENTSITLALYNSQISIGNVNVATDGSLQTQLTRLPAYLEKLWVCSTSNINEVSILDNVGNARIGLKFTELAKKAIRDNGDVRFDIKVISPSNSVYNAPTMIISDESIVNSSIYLNYNFSELGTYKIICENLSYTVLVGGYAKKTPMIRRGTEMIGGGVKVRWFSDDLYVYITFNGILNYIANNNNPFDSGVIIGSDYAPISPVKVPVHTSTNGFVLEVTTGGKIRIWGSTSNNTGVNTSVMYPLKSRIPDDITIV